MYLQKVLDHAEQLQTELTLVKKENNDQKVVLERRRCRGKGKRLVIKDKVLITTEEIQKGLQEAEAETATRKKRGRPRKAKKVPQEEVEASDHDSGDENRVE
jgi:hypothetical protein